MTNKLHTFFHNNDFDIYEPNLGHLDRFQDKLRPKRKKTLTSWKWISIAASVILILGLYLGNIQNTKSQYSLVGISPKMTEAEIFFVSTIKQELKEVEKHRSIETETLIEDALDKFEELEDKFKTFSKELLKNENKRYIIRKMINNYQQRLNILNELLTQLEHQKNTKFEIKYDEII
ncbi:hypothetical protein [Tenacibaculum sp. nBUS_03]|uniref:hypothetical protein n=1 Tax=Tenacibaculum sp. nBUS_03 TaxID=3395320 RepID=UPI003EB9323E